jgi:hypothetical protein
LRFYSRDCIGFCFLSIFTPRGGFRRAAHHFAEGKASSTASGRHHGATPRIIARPCAHAFLRAQRPICLYIMQFCVYIGNILKNLKNIGKKS